jgi:two-component system NtrC family sensor kinase
MPTRHEQSTLPKPADGSASRDVLAAAIDSLHAGLVLFDRRLNVILRNNAARTLLPDVNDVAKLLSTLAVESSYEDWTTEIRKVMDTGLSRRLDVTVRQGEANPESCVEIVISALRDPLGGETLGGMLLAEDVTSRASMERRLAVSERLAAVGKMAARVAHEMNNPLDGILRYTNLALRVAEGAAPPVDAAGDSPIAKLKLYLNNAKSGILRMADIISAMLEFSRNAPSTLEQATINRIVEDAVTAMEGRAEEAGVTVVCNFLQTDMPVIRGSNIFQVCCNLIKNAIEAMSDGGTLTITTRLTEADVVVTFEDTGTGLPKEAEMIFEPFFTTKAPGKGTGLGLAVCKELVEKYSGTITAANRAPHGAVFTVTIPTPKLAVATGHGT